MSDAARGRGSEGDQSPERTRRRPVPSDGPYYPPRSEPLRAPWDPSEPAEGRRRSVPGGRDHLRRQSPLGRFVTVWGWRAYAIPVLLVLTALVVADAMRDPGDGAVDQTSSSADPSVISDAPAGDGPVAVPPSGELPEGGPFVQHGDGTFRVLPGSGARVGRGTEHQYTYTVEVENGIDTTDSGGDAAVAQMIDATLSNPKSWTADGKVSLQRVDSGEPSFRVSLTSPDLVRSRCGYDIELESSCYNPADDRVYLNLSRWVRGARSFQGDMGSYRQYQINHEVGHAVGHPNHEPCPRTGALAPVMMQQTFGVANREIHDLDPQGVVPDDDAVCRYNAWPFPGGRSGR